MIAEQAGKLISKFIEKSWPHDQDEVYEILRLAVNKAWQEGKWYGMTAEYSVPVECDRAGGRHVIAPKTHPTLLAVNINGKPENIRDHYFSFHKNGKGTIDNEGCDWNQNVVDVGTTPIINKHNINFDEGVVIGIRSLGPIGPDEKVWVDGEGESGKVYTFRNKLESGTSCSIPVNALPTTKELVNGIEIKVIDGFHYINNIKFFNINNINKTKTISPIEVITIDCNNNAKQVAVLMPGETISQYRKYLVPSKFSNYARGLFKIGMQDIITSGADRLIIQSEEAIISLAKGIYLMYYKEDMERGAIHIINGISILEKERREEESPTVFPLQVDPMGYMDIPQQLRR